MINVYCYLVCLWFELFKFVACPMWYLIATIACGTALIVELNKIKNKEVKG